MTPTPSPSDIHRLIQRHNRGDIALTINQAKALGIPPDLLMPPSDNWRNIAQRHILANDRKIGDMQARINMSVDRVGQMFIAVAVGVPLGLVLVALISTFVG